MKLTRKAATISMMLVLSQPLTATALAQTRDGEGRRVCRSPQTTATRMAPARICKSVAEWREIDRVRDQRAESEGQIFQRERVESQPPSVPAPN